jgi:hypothetical protein
MANSSQRGEGELLVVAFKWTLTTDANRFNEFKRLAKQLWMVLSETSSCAGSRARWHTVPKGGLRRCTEHGFLLERGIAIGRFMEEIIKEAAQCPEARQTIRMFCKGQAFE